MINSSKCTSVTNIKVSISGKGQLVLSREKHVAALCIRFRGTWLIANLEHREMHDIPLKVCVVTHRVFNY